MCRPCLTPGGFVALSDWRHPGSAARVAACPGRRRFGDRPGSAWFHLGAAKVVFDFTITHGLVHAITFRAAPEVLSRVVRRDGGAPRG
jgi:hypothetical protein